MPSGSDSDANVPSDEAVLLLAGSRVPVPDDSDDELNPDGHPVDDACGGATETTDMPTDGEGTGARSDVQASTRGLLF